MWARRLPEWITMSALEAVEEIRRLLPRGRQHGALRAALDPHAGCGLLRDPRWQAPRAGGGELRGVRSAAALAGDDGAIRGIYDAKIRPLVHQRW